MKFKEVVDKGVLYHHTFFFLGAKVLGILIRKMNMDNTKMVWIGKNKYSQVTMCVKWGLEWGSNRFTLQGINLSVQCVRNGIFELLS